MKKLVIMLLVLVLAASAVSCAATGTAGGAYQVTDSRGTAVSFDMSPKKVVSLMPSNTEIIYALGEGGSLVAVSTYCNYPEDTANKKKLDAGMNMNIEEIIALEPDLVIFGAMMQTDDQIALLEKSGIKTIVTEAYSIADAYVVIELIGKIYKKEKEAGVMIRDMKKAFEEIAEEVKQYVSKKVYIEISPLEYGLWTCGKGTFQDELITLVGSENIFSDVEGWGQVSEEQVLSRDPEAIISTVGTLFDKDSTIQEIASRKNWEDVSAVKNSAIYLIDSDAIQRPGPRLADAARDLVNYIYNK